MAVGPTGPSIRDSLAEPLQLDNNKKYRTKAHHVQETANFALCGNVTKSHIRVFCWQLLDTQAGVFGFGDPTSDASSQNYRSQA